MQAGRAGPPIRSDGFSYYVYLPSWFIFHDPSLAAVGARLLRRRVPRLHGDHPLAGHQPMGERASDRRRGDAAPFFAVAHALTRWTNLSADGFTLYYQHAAGLWPGCSGPLPGCWCSGGCSSAISPIA